MSRVFANQAIRIRQTGITQSLQVPALLQPQPVRTSGVQLAEDLEAAFNAVAGAVATSLAFTGAGQEREIAAQKGLAAEHFPGILSEARETINALGLPVDQSSKGIQARTDELFTQMTEGQSNAYKDYLRERFNDAIIEHMDGLVEEKNIQNANVEAGTQVAFANAGAIEGGTEGEEDVRTGIANMIEILEGVDGVSHFDAISKTQVIYEAIATAGNPDMLDKVGQEFNALFPTKFAEIKARAENVRTEKTTKRINTMVLDVLNDPDVTSTESLNIKWGEIKQFIEQTPGLSDGDKLTQIRRVKALQHDQAFDEISTLIADGHFQLTSEIQTRIDMLKEEGVFTGTDEAALMSLARRKQGLDNSTKRVLAVITGDSTATLTEAGDTTALDLAVGPEGLGLIDIDNKITNAAELGRLLVKTKITTPNIRAILSANLASVDVETVRKAGVVYGLIGNGSLIQYVELIEEAGVVMGAPVQIAMDGFNPDSVNLTDEVVNNVRQARAEALEQPKVKLARTPPPEFDVPAHVSSQATRYIDLTGISDDWIFNATDQTISEFDMRFLTARFNVAFNNASIGNVSDSIALKSSTRNIDAWLRRTYDVSRWDEDRLGAEHVQLVDITTLSARMPDWLRQTPQTERLAKADLAAMPILQEIKDSVIGMAPYLVEGVGPDGDDVPEKDRREEKAGWVFRVQNGVSVGNLTVSVKRELEDGTFVTEDQIVIWRPPIETKDENLKYQKFLDDKIRGFSGRVRVDFGLVPFGAPIGVPLGEQGRREIPDAVIDNSTFGQSNQTILNLGGVPFGVPATGDNQ